MNIELILRTLAALLVVAVPAALLYMWDRRLLRTFAVALGRMAVQVGAVCVVVWLLWRFDHWWLRLLWVVAMSVGSAVIVVWRTRLGIRHLWLSVAAAQLLGCVAVGGWLLLVAAPLWQSIGAHAFVPLMALLFGHTTFSLIRGLSHYVGALRADEQHYEFLRGNGRSHLGALMPFVRRSLQAVMAPTSASVAEMGRFTMPLLLVGLLLTGADLTAGFLATVVLTAGCVAASTVTLILALWLCDRWLFDQLGRLNDQTDNHG